MDKEQKKVLESAGYSISEVATHRQQKMTLFKPERRESGNGQIIETGNWIACPNLPADPKSLARYMSRGFRFNMPAPEGEKPVPVHTPPVEKPAKDIIVESNLETGVTTIRDKEGNEITAVQEPETPKKKVIHRRKKRKNTNKKEVI